MKKYPIGFNTRINKEPENGTQVTSYQEIVQPKKSIVQVYFPHRGMGWAYYNDSFDLKVGDFVYVEGKLEGYRGQVTEVNYSFKIKLSDYKKVIVVIDTNVKGDFYLAGSHVVSFDPNAIPYSKILNWFKAPENDEEYVSGNDDAFRFPLDDLSKMKISHDAADRGYDYYIENRVGFVEVDSTRGHAIMEGSENYEIEFDYIDGEISNLKCSCFCSGTCKHEFAAMLQLKESLELITENYEDEYNGYFAIISKGVFNEDYTAYLLEKYDHTYYPERMINAGKAAYVERNYEMIDNSSYCVVYYDENYMPPRRKNSRRELFDYQPSSGTAVAYDYAVKKEKSIINLDA